MIDIKKTTKKLQSDVRDQTTSYLVAALSVVAGLAWNDAVKELITVIFPEQASGLFAKFAYAAIITLVVVTLTMIVKRALGQKSDE